MAYQASAGRFPCDCAMRLARAASTVSRFLRRFLDDLDGKRPVGIPLRPNGYHSACVCVVRCSLNAAATIRCPESNDRSVEDHDIRLGKMHLHLERSETERRRCLSDLGPIGCSHDPE